MNGLRMLAAIFVGGPEQKCRHEALLDEAKATVERARAGRERAEATARLPTVEAFEGIAKQGKDGK